MSRFLLVLLSLYSAVSFAQSPYRKTPGTPTCLTDDKCEYQTVNAPASIVIQMVNNTVLGGRGSCGTSDVYICKGDGPNTILFAHKDKKVLDELKTRIPLFDRLPKMSEVPLVEVAVDVYAVTEEAFSRLNIELTDVGFGMKDKSSEKTIKREDGGTKIGLNFGGAKFNALIAAERGQGQVDFVTSVVRYVPNNQDISYQNSREIVKAVGVGDKQTITAGLRMDGKVNIADGDVPLVYIENYSITYGVPDPAANGEITTLAVNESMLPIKPGVAYGLSSDSKTTTVRGRATGVFKLSRKKEDSRAQLLVVMKARPLSWTQFIAESIEQLGEVEVNPQMKLTDLDGLERCGTLEAVMNNVKPFAKPIRGGNYIVGFSLGACQADESFYSQHLDIQVKTKGYEDKAMRSLQNLMAGQYRFAAVPNRLFSEPKVEFKLSLKEIRTGKKQEINLIFNPDTAEIFRK